MTAPDGIATQPLARLMSRDVVAIGPRTTVAEALRRAAAAGTQHLVVFEDEQLVGVVCRCDLERARPDVTVDAVARRAPVTADATATIDGAAALMRTRAVGCLPVLSGGLLLGVVTRSDLLRAGVRPEEVGGPCAGCGSLHALAPGRAADDGPAFCRECLDCRAERDELGRAG